MSIRFTGAAIAGIASAVAGNPIAAETVRGQWNTHRQSEGPALTLSDPSSQVIFLHGLCTDGGVKLTTMVPARGGYPRAHALIGRTIRMTFAFGTLRFVYAGAVHDDGEMIAVSMPARLSDPLFRRIAAGGAMELASPRGAISLPLEGAGDAVAAWSAACGAPIEEAKAPVPADFPPAGRPGAALPPELQLQRDSTTAECREDGGTPGASPDFIRSVDFNGDGRPDYVVDHGKFDCARVAKRSCGSAGCSIDVFLSGKAGYRDRVSLSGYETVIDAGGERPTLIINGRERAVRYRWNGRAFVHQ
jgi:hypothetical protein